MEFNFKLEYQNSRQDVARAFNKTAGSLYTQSRIYKAKGGKRGLLNSGQQIPYSVFVSRVIRNTPKEFWEFFLNDENFRSFDIIKNKRFNKR